LKLQGKNLEDYRSMKNRVCEEWVAVTNRPDQWSCRALWWGKRDSLHPAKAWKGKLSKMKLSATTTEEGRGREREEPSSDVDRSESGEHGDEECGNAGSIVTHTWESVTRSPALHFEFNSMQTYARQWCYICRRREKDEKTIWCCGVVWWVLVAGQVSHHWFTPFPSALLFLPEADLFEWKEKC